MKAISSVVVAYAFYCFACDDVPDPDGDASPMDGPWDSSDRTGILFRNQHYDYAPSVLDAGDVRHFWWCGRGSDTGDDIYHRSVDLRSGTPSPIVRVLTSSPGRWDGLHACDPSVVAGSFTNPEDGRGYAYAMYYGATDRLATNNRIGVAFSNDTVDWVKLSTPIVHPADPSDPGYGAGQPAAINTDGSSRIYLFHTDTTASPPGVGLRVSDDGIHFGPFFPVASRQGVPFHADADFSWDPRDHRFHAVAPYAARAGDRTEYAIGLFSIADTDVVNRMKSWRLDGVIDTNLTGSYLNHSACLRRNGLGLRDDSSDTLEVYFGAGENDPSTWDLTWAVMPASPTTLPLARYVDARVERHWVTSGHVPSGYAFEETLGHLFRTEHPGTLAAYSCRVGDSDDSDHFVSIRPDCEGRVALGVHGWGFAVPPAEVETRPLYRCRADGEHFLSRRADCEGATTENGGRPFLHALTMPH